MFRENDGYDSQHYILKVSRWWWQETSNFFGVYILKRSAFFLLKKCKYQLTIETVFLHFTYLILSNSIEVLIYWNLNLIIFLTDPIRLKCWQLKSLTLCDGKYYEMVKGNFDRAERHRVVRATNSYSTSIVSLVSRYKDLQFN